MTAARWDPVTVYRTGRDRLRASDADRDQVIDTLTTAFVQGRLAKEEFCTRAGRVLASRTYGELAAVTLGIPPRREAPSPRPAPARNQNRIETKTLVWGMFMMLMPATLGTAFLTHYVGFFAMFVIAFIGVTVTAQPGG